MRQPIRCYSSVNSTIHHRAQSGFAAGNARLILAASQWACFLRCQMTWPRQRGSAACGNETITPLPDGQWRARSQAGASASGARLADAVTGSPDAAGPSSRRASGLLPDRPGTCHRLAYVRGRGSGLEAAERSAGQSASAGQSGWGGPRAEHRPSRIPSARGVAGPRRRTRTTARVDAFRPVPEKCRPGPHRRGVAPALACSRATIRP